MRSRIESRIEGKLVKTESCWNWIGGHNGRGYGTAFNEKSRKEYVHRISYRLWVGPIPGGKMVLHSCDNPRCCNPNHLFLGTQKDNMGDCKIKGRSPRGEKNGHAVVRPEMVSQIKDLYASGEITQQEVADTFGLTRGMVHGIVIGRNWTHLDPRIIKVKKVRRNR